MDSRDRNEERMNESKKGSPGVQRVGIILAGGSGTRLHPVTMAVSKQLLPIYDKPMIYYPMSVLMLAGIREILIITTPHDQAAFQRLLGDGSQFGIQLSWCVQPKPEGLAQAFTLGEPFIDGRQSCLILGDNLFYGEGFNQLLQSVSRSTDEGATIFAYPVRDPERYGVVQYDPATGVVQSLEEKPKKPKSSFAVPGLYFYDHRVCQFANSLRPSPREELEITDLNRIYMELGQLKVRELGRGFAWLDTGTHRSLIEASNFVEALQERQGLQIACLEEIAWDNRWITDQQLQTAAQAMGKSKYAEYLNQLTEKRSAN
jgi:glucose-1-phosphate thymidylyltransferase